MRYLGDTNIVSELSRPNPNQNVVRKLKIHQHEIAVSTVTVGEILTGLNQMPESRRKERVDVNLQRWLSFAVILDYDLKAAIWFGDEYARLAVAGLKPSFADTQIAAVAATNNLTLVTRNVKDFAQFDGLQVENWFEA